MIGHMFDLLRTVRLFSRAVALFYILKVMRLPVFHILANIFYCIFNCSHPSGYEVKSHCIRVLICIALANDDDLFMGLLEIHRSPLRNVCLDLCFLIGLASVSVQVSAFKILVTWQSLELSLASVIILWLIVSLDLEIQGWIRYHCH